MISETYNRDCVEAMKEFKDNHFDLAVVDPPYGIGADKKNSTSKLQTSKSASRSTFYGNQDWDSNIPTKEYFDELKRVSKRQLIWGANYFGLKGGYLYWHKNVTMPTYSQGELAYLSWLNKVDFVEITWHGMIQQNMKNKEIRIHPTHKPIALYDWIFQNYAKEGDLILDTHLGSQSSRIAAHKHKLDFIGFEIDKDYFEEGNKRYETFASQLTLF